MAEFIQFPDEKRRTIRRGVIDVRVTRNDLAKLLASIQKKSKSLKTTLRRVAMMVAKIHLKHYEDQEGPDASGEHLVPWLPLKQSYAYNPTGSKKKKNPQYRDQMMRNYKDEIYNEIASQTDGEDGGGFMVRDSSFEVGISSYKYWALHEGKFLRYRGTDYMSRSRSMRKYRTPVPSSELARRIIGIVPSEEEEVINELESTYYEELVNI